MMHDYRCVYTYIKGLTLSKLEDNIIIHIYNTYKEAWRTMYFSNNVFHNYRLPNVSHL